MNCISSQAAVGFDYAGKTEKHQSQTGLSPWKQKTTTKIFFHAILDLNVCFMVKLRFTIGIKLKKNNHSISS